MSVVLIDVPADRLFRLDGRVAFVSGAAGHLGRAISTALAEAGAHVILNGRRRDKLEALKEALLARGFRASVACFDVTDDSSVADGFSDISRTHGRLDVLVNNAYEGSPGTLESSRSEDFVRAYDVAVVAAYRCLMASKRLLLKAVETTGHASVINIASMYASVSPDPSIYSSTGMDNPPFYGAAKAALVQFTRYAACHLGPEGIRVNAVSPGPFPRESVAQKHPAFWRELSRKCPMGRVGQPAELKGAILFLASDASTYVTGINLPVDGGWTAW